MKLSGKVALVTGGATGIGRAITLRLATEGADVTLADVNADGAKATIDQVWREGGRAEFVAADVTSKAQVESAVGACIDRCGRIDLLVTCAAIFPTNEFCDIPEAEWDRVIAVNLKGTFLVCQAVARHMIERKKGRIVTISSDIFQSAAFFSHEMAFAHYVASKGGVIGLTRAMARELGPYGISVNSVAPGLTWTDAGLSLKETMDPFYTTVRQARSLLRDAWPEDVTGAVVFLASPDSAFMTGQTLLVEGGQFFS